MAFTTFGESIGSVIETAATTVTNTIQGILEYLFVPTRSMEVRNAELQDIVYEKMPFLETTDLFMETVIDATEDATGTPAVLISLPAKYGGQQVNVLDLTWVLPYLNMAWGFLVPFIYILWFWKLGKRIPHWIDAGKEPAK